MGTHGHARVHSILGHALGILGTRSHRYPTCRPQACGRGGAYAGLHRHVAHMNVHGRYGYAKAPAGHTRIPAHTHPCTHTFSHTEEPPHIACTHCQGTVPGQSRAARSQAPAKMCEVTLSVVRMCIFGCLLHTCVSHNCVSMPVHAAERVLAGTYTSIRMHANLYT